MIQISRILARQLRSVLRKVGAGRLVRPLLELCSHDGLGIRAQLYDLAIEYHLPGPNDHDTILLPWEALADFMGRRDEPVTLEKIDDDAVQASWHDAGIPRTKRYPIEKSSQPPFPGVPSQSARLDPAFLKALHDASLCVARDEIRYATKKIQLRGTAGEIIATDGRQALIQTGFSLPWKEDVLIPGVDIFGADGIPKDSAVQVGKGEDHIYIEVGAWKVWLTIDKEGRFPSVVGALPKPSARPSTWHLSASDTDFLASSLSKLPGNGEDFSPVTVDLNGRVSLRAKEEEQPQATEVVLTGSQVTGPPVCFHSDRRFLARAGALGMTEISVAKADVPIVSKDSTRTYVWVPLTTSLIIPPSDNAIRITTQEDSSIPQPHRERTRSPMPSPHTNGNGHAPTDNHGNGAAHDQDSSQSGGSSLGALIAEAQALKDVMQKAFSQSSRFVIALKRHRKQSRLVASTLASLRQLQQIGG